MTVGQELLTKLKQRFPNATLWQFHKILGCSDQYIYQIWDARSEMGADSILVVCDVLQIDPQPYLLRAEISRCRSPKRREILERILERMGVPVALGALALWLAHYPVFLALSTT